MIRVLITDDHPVVRRGIRQILEDNERISLVEEAGNGKELIEKLKKQVFDVILLDISLPGRSGLDLIPEIKKIQKSAGILILSIHSEEIYARKAIKYGASGYLTKLSAPEELLAAVYKIAGGGKYISASLAEKISFKILGENDDPLRNKLSGRELEVISLLASGKTLSNIAEYLSLSPKTISTYRRRILEKLNLKTTSDIIRFSIIEKLS
jgi:two-component system, NarL family, invasion response regulator UvrY